MANELYKIEGWIPAMVAADSALTAIVGTKVFSGRAPQKTDTFNPFPCVIYAMIIPTVNKFLDRAFVMASPQYKIVVADENDFDSTAWEAVARVMAIFGHVETNIFESNVFNCYLDELFTDEETDSRNDTRYQQKGGMFRIESYPNV